jgi:[acyl-carrier-protein] S-malonyltransferase
MAEKLIKIPEARDMYHLAKEILGYDLLEICQKGPKHKLNQTVYAQPAIAVTSLASLERLKEARPNSIDFCVATAGFSLGELTALIFSEAISFEDGLKLIQVRAEAMQMASDKSPSGMATVFYGPDSKLGEACVKAKEWCLDRGLENPECKIANYLYPHCKVVAGSLEALDFLEKNKQQFRLRKIRRLPVSGAFHTSFMEPAVRPFQKALNQIEIKNPNIYVHSCVDGKAYRNAEHIRKQLPKQIIKSVKWEQLLHIMYERGKGAHFPQTFECSPGSSLMSILKEVNGQAFNSAISVEK